MDLPSLPAHLAPGTLAFGRFVVERPLGEGGMAHVALARHVALDVEVALKVPRESSPGAAERLRTEARLLWTARHRGVVHVFDAGIDETRGPWLAMEHVRGESLAGLLRSVGTLPSERALSILGELAEALDHVHARGIVHRDVKPANVLLGRDGVRLCDFGIALGATERAVLADPAARAARPWLEGTPEYMSPEQVIGAAVGPAADRWALAAMALEMLTGRRPYPTQATTGRTLLCIAERPPRRAREAGLDGEAIQAFFERALSRRPGERPRSCARLVDELRRALRTTSWIPAAGDVGEVPTLRLGPQSSRAA